MRARIDALVDGELDAGEAARVRAHLDRCPACAEEYEALRRTRRALACWTAPEADARLTAAFAARLAMHRSRPARWTRLFGQPLSRLAWAAGLACALGIGLVYWYQRPPAPAPVTETAPYAAIPDAPPPAPRQRTPEQSAVTAVKTPPVERPRTRPRRTAEPPPPRITVTAAPLAETDPTVVLDEHLAETTNTWEPAVAAAHVSSSLDGNGAGWMFDAAYATTTPALERDHDTAATPEDLVMAALMEVH
ncbi:MAG TPA: zf-HC2 domain-containing protein [Armatimonadota bacterium]|nr:zf-HC2 domain-containing protein [Armatimonadota bacterium]